MENRSSIYFGLSSFKDHPYYSLTSTSSLYDYARNCDLIELDTTFYAIPSKRQVEKWQQQVPPSFLFSIKAYAAMTLHQPYTRFFKSKEEMFQQFKENIMPLKKTNQLATVLFQFSPMFDFSIEHAWYLRFIRHALDDWPVAIELRHASWYERDHIKKSLQLFKDLKFRLVAVDEPQVSCHTVPFFIYPTSVDLYVRFHGRNKSGWLSNKRELRTYYDYSKEELQEIARKLKENKHQFEHIYCIFNNNSGHHAAKNLDELKEMMQVTPQKRHPKQLELFSLFHE